MYKSMCMTNRNVFICVWILCEVFFQNRYAVRLEKTFTGMLFPYFFFIMDAPPAASGAKETLFAISAFGFLWHGLCFWCALVCWISVLNPGKGSMYFIAAEFNNIRDEFNSLKETENKVLVAYR